MADNDRMQWDINDLPYQQLSPAGLARTEYYPGKATSRPGDLLVKEFRSPVGLPQFEANGPLEVEHVRVALLRRGSVSDQTIAVPIAGTPVVTVIDDESVWGVGALPEHTLTPTETQDVNGEQERTAGYDWAKGA